MAYTKSTTPTNTNPLGLDAAINKINDSIDLSWLHKFGLSYLRNEEPMVREFGKIEYKSLIPNDSLLTSSYKGISFWHPISDINADEFEISNQSVIYDRDVTLIVWVDLNKLYSTNPAMTAENLINDILKNLTSTMKFRVESIKQGAEVWSDFTLPDNNKYFELPYHTIGITGNISYQYKLNC